MDQPDDTPRDRIRRQQPRRTRYAILSAVFVFAFLGTCFVIPSAIYDAMFMNSVLLERMGWRFEGKYEVGWGITTQFSKLTYRGQEVGQSLPDDVHLVTPVGEFYGGQSGWNAARSDPQIWDDAYRLPEVEKGEPWVMQIDDGRDIKEFLAQGFYQAPADVRRYGVPWTDRQLKGTPPDWVYVYRLSWRDPEHDSYSSHAVRGYWVAPARLDDLKWEEPFEAE